MLVGFLHDCYTMLIKTTVFDGRFTIEVTFIIVLACVVLYRLRVESTLPVMDKLALFAIVDRVVCKMGVSIIITLKACLLIDHGVVFLERHLFLRRLRKDFKLTRNTIWRW